MLFISLFHVNHDETQNGGKKSGIEKRAKIKSLSLNCKAAVTERERKHLEICQTRGGQRCQNVRFDDEQLLLGLFSQQEKKNGDF